MATKFRLEHKFPTISLKLFEAHLNDPVLNRALSGMPAFRSRELVEKTDDSDGTTTWKFKVIAGGNVPPAVQKVVSEDMFAWWESSRFYPKEHCIRWNIEPLFKKVKFSGEGIWQLNKDGKGTSRVIEGALSVQIPFVGGLVEKFLVSELKKNYEVEPDLQREFYESKL